MLTLNQWDGILYSRLPDIPAARHITGGKDCQKERLKPLLLVFGAASTLKHPGITPPKHITQLRELFRRVTVEELHRPHDRRIFSQPRPCSGHALQSTLWVRNGDPGVAAFYAITFEQRSLGLYALIDLA